MTFGEETHPGVPDTLMPLETWAGKRSFFASGRKTSPNLALFFRSHGLLADLAFEAVSIHSDGKKQNGTHVHDTFSGLNKKVLSKPTTRYQKCIKSPSQTAQPVLAVRSPPWFSLFMGRIVDVKAEVLRDGKMLLRAVEHIHHGRSALPEDVAAWVLQLEAGLAPVSIKNDGKMMTLVSILKCTVAWYQKPCCF